jgi:predicted DNA-binding protein with PD1-like motif
MQSKENKNIVFIRLFPNEDVNIELKKACKKHNVKTAVVLSGIGQLKETEIGYFKTRENYLPEKISISHEIFAKIKVNMFFIYIQYLEMKIKKH